MRSEEGVVYAVYSCGGRNVVFNKLVMNIKNQVCKVKTY